MLMMTSPARMEPARANAYGAERHRGSGAGGTHIRVRRGGTTFSQVEAYNPRNNSWSSHMRMPTSRHGLGAAPVAGRIYVISGGPTGFFLFSARRAIAS
jgi:hypothetical protein